MRRPSSCHPGCGSQVGSHHRPTSATPGPRKRSIYMHNLGLSDLEPHGATAGSSFVSMMSYQGVPVEEIARLAGHASSRTTEVIYRRELRPVITTGAEVMDQIFQHRKQRAGTAGDAAR